MKSIFILSVALFGSSTAVKFTDITRETLEEGADPAQVTRHKYEEELIGDESEFPTDEYQMGEYEFNGGIPDAREVGRIPTQEDAVEEQEKEAVYTFTPSSKGKPEDVMEDEDDELNA